MEISLHVYAVFVYDMAFESGSVMVSDDDVPFVNVYVLVPLSSGSATLSPRSAVLKFSIISSAFSTAYCFFVEVVVVFVAAIRAFVIG